MGLTKERAGLQVVPATLLTTLGFTVPAATEALEAALIFLVELLICPALDMAKMAGTP